MEWRIKDFSSLSQDTDIRYHSPIFYFSGASWYIRFYPNGQTEDDSEGWLGLFLMRMSSGSAVNLNFSLSFKRVDEKNVPVKNTGVFDKKNSGWGRHKLISRIDLMEKKSDIIPSDTLTVLCTLKNSEPNGVAGSLFSRYQELSDNLKEIYENEKRTDCILKIDGDAIPAHRMILQARSPVFAAMFNHDTKENETGEIHIADVEKSTMEAILEYVYSGDIEDLEVEEALSLYAAAEKYDMKSVQIICSEFIMRKLSVDCVCDVIKFDKLYHDEKVSCRAREYFKENVREILKTEKWTVFAKENTDISIELLSSVVTDLPPEKRCPNN